MVNKHCAHSLCTNDSRYMDRPHMEGVKFFRFPNKKWHREKCIRWANSCKRVGFAVDDVTEYTYICSNHFYGGQGPTREHPDPISATTTLEQSEELNTTGRTLQSIPLPTPEEPFPLQYTTEKSTSADVPSPASKRHKTYSKHETYSKHCFFKPMELETDVMPGYEDSHGQESVMFDSPQKCQPQNVLRGHNMTEVTLFQYPMLTDQVLMTSIIHVMDKGWIIGRTEAHLDFYLYNGTTMTKSIHFNYQTGSYEVEFDGNQIEKLTVTSLPEYISSEIYLQETLDKISKAKLCGGLCSASEQRLKSLATEQYSIKCTRLAGEKTDRCSNCIKGRKVLMKRVSRLCNESKHRATNLPREQLMSRLRMQQYKSLLVERKLVRARNRIQKSRVSGHALCNSDAQLLNGIIKENVTTVSKNDPLRLMLTEQLKAAKSGQGMRWDPDIVKWAAYVHHKSATAYEAISSFGYLKLPSASTIVRMYADFKHGTGIHHDVLNDMVKQANLGKVPDHQRYMALVIDEMKIRSNIMYNKHTGKLVGFTESASVAGHDGNLSKRLGQVEDIPDVATHMLAFFVRGLTSNFKYSFAHYPTNKLTADALYGKVWQAIQSLEQFGFRVLIVVADGAGPNRKLFKYCSNLDVPYKCSNPCAEDEERSLYFIFDPPHLLKTTRNCLYNSRSNNGLRRMWRNGNEVTWDHIMEVYLSSVGTSWRDAWHISEEHVMLTSFSIMNVRLAAQVMSSTFAAVVESRLGDKAAETVKLMRLMDKWFDCLNVSNITSHVKKRNDNLRQYTSEDDPRLQWLAHTFLTNLAEWKEEIARRPNYTQEEKARMFLSKETFEGHQVTAHTICEVIPFLLNKGAQYVLTSHFSQDVLEQEFSRQRHAGGSNENPNVTTFCQNARKLNATRAYLRGQKNGNTLVTD